MIAVIVCAASMAGFALMGETDFVIAQGFLMIALLLMHQDRSQ